MAETDKNNSEKKIDIERRKFPRLNTSTDVEYIVIGKTLAGEKKTVTKNISAGGICLIVYEKIETATVLDLRIYLRDINATIEARGQVKWSSYFTMAPDSRPRYDIGIEFIEIKEPDRQQLSKYVLDLIR